MDAVVHESKKATSKATESKIFKSKNKSIFQSIKI